MSEMSKDTSTYAKFLMEMQPGSLFFTDGPFFTHLNAHLEREKAKDDAYLASLTPHARKVELTRRRITSAERRFRAALDFTRCECDD